MLENTVIRLIEVKHELIKYNTSTDQVNLFNYDMLNMILKF